jgi:DNA-binding beta-propeller fold protein YncE
MNRRIQYCGIIIGIALTLALLGPGLNLVPVLGAPLMSSASTSVLASGLEGLLGSTVGPDGALYVAQGTTGSISRIDPKTGVVTTFVSGLPQMMQAIGLGGPTDVAFVGRTMYVLVTFVSKMSEATPSTASIDSTVPIISRSLLISELSIFSPPDYFVSDFCC